MKKVQQIAREDNRFASYLQTVDTDTHQLRNANKTANGEKINRYSKKQSNTQTQQQQPQMQPSKNNHHPVSTPYLERLTEPIFSNLTLLLNSREFG